jgi:hypothetical protein
MVRDGFRKLRFRLHEMFQLIRRPLLPYQSDARRLGRNALLQLSDNGSQSGISDQEQAITLTGQHDAALRLSGDNGSPPA